MGASTNVTITAVYGGVTKTAILTVTPAPPALAGITVNPTTVVATASGNGTATLNQPAPAGGAVVTLSSSDPAVASVPSTITVAAGSTSAGFGITTYAVPADAGVTISGSYGGVGKTAALSVIATFSLTLDDGNGPIYTKLGTVGVKGRVAPAIVGPRVLVRGTLGAQNVTVTPASNGTFTLPSLTLALGSNAISVTGTSGSQSVGPVSGTYVYDNVVPTASVILNTNVPNPTNVATWTLSGTVSPYQGAAENAFVYLNGGTTRFPIAGNGTWSGSYTFTEGRNWIPFVVADLAGNFKNPADSWDKHTFYLDTLGLGPLISVGEMMSGTEITFGWPSMLDGSVIHRLSFGTDSGASLNGSHLDVFFDEQGSVPGGSPVNCAPDNLTCLVTRKLVPDLSLDFPVSGEIVTPKLAVGIHTVRMVLRDPFGIVYERGAIIPVGWRDSSSSDIFLPLANFATPGIVTTQRPKLVGRMVDGVAPLDCNDNVGNRLPAFSYWNPQGGGSWQPLSVTATSLAGGIYQVTPGSNIPATTLASGDKVLRIKLTEGVVKQGGFTQYLEGVAGRNICSGQTVLTSSMKYILRYWGPTAVDVPYDLPYRSSSTGDSTSPQVDVSGLPQTVATDTSGPYTLTTRLRVTDLNADLDYRNVTVATAGCTDASCTYSARLAGDQLLASALPGGHFTLQLPLVVGANNFVANARDDGGHITTQSFTINRTLTEVEAKITSPSATGVYAFCSPKSVTFDASQSVNRTNPPTGLRYQWTASSTLISNQPAYTETLQFSGSRRVIVSSLAISAPNAQASDPCAGNSGKCSVATIDVQPYAVSTTTLPAQVLSPPNGASVRMDLPVTLDGTVGQFSESYVYKWRLKRTSDGVFLTIPQSTGPGSDPSYAAGNRTLTLRLDSIPGVVGGGYTLFFDAAHLTSAGGCIEQKTTTSIGITITTKVYTATGVAPGAVVVGDGSTRLYGSGFDAAARIAISGPIYALGNITTPLCTMPACPQVAVLPAVGPNGTTLDFTVPASLAPGYYQVFAADPATGAASSPVWLEVQPLQGTAPAKTQSFSGIINPILNGQTLNGQFLAGRDPSGEFSDVDYYYFFATAGSSLDLSLTRSDTTLPWEAPDALDPQLVVVDPDGIIWQGFESLDNQAGVDLNASLTDLVLPKTGRYIVDAASSKGFGPYQLTFSLTPAPPPPTRQVLPATNNDRTVPLNTAGLKPMAFTFDPRGHPLSGAVAQFVSVPEANETGQISFPGGSTIATSTRGFAQVDATLIAAGKVSFEARLLDTGLVVPQGKIVTQASPPPPAYRPLGIVSRQEQGTDPLTGAWTASFDKIERLELEPPDLPVVAFRTGKDGKKIRQQGQVGTHSRAGPSRMLKHGQTSTGSSASPGVGPLSMDVITTCSPGQFRAAGVTALQVQGPFTVTLKDLTPKTGESSTPPAEEVIGVAGINSHRVDKTIRIRFEIKDAAGAEPNYPVLVRLSLVGGSPSGTLILDPDGARTPCQSASFLWHERDAQGQIIALNEEFEYQLTKRSAFVGVKPDPENPGEVLPVWGTTEFLNASFGTFDAQDGTLTNQFSAKYGVHPEPGTPHHLKWNPTAPEPAHEWKYLTTYDADFRFPTYTNNEGLANLYYLADVFDNPTYGHTSTSATNPQPNVQVAFAAQLVSDDPTVGTAAYRLTINWNDEPQWPNGSYVSTLTVTGTDIETGPFSVSGNFTAMFAQPEFHSLVWVDAYEQPYDVQIDDTVVPPVAITHVSPDAARTRLNGELSRTSILLVTGNRLSWTSQTPEGWISFEGSPGDPKIVTDGVDSFDVSLVDDKGNLVTDGTIKVSLCPVLDHRAGQPTSGQIDTRPCPPEQVSAGGVLPGVRPIDRGYMGLMVTKAPAAPGVYFFRIRPVPSNVHQWRVGGSLDPMNNYTYTYAVTVQDGEFLDENFQRINPLLVRDPRQVYLRLIDGTTTEDTQNLTVHAMDKDNQELGIGVPITVPRLGVSKTFLAPLVLYRDGDIAPKGAGGASRLAVRSGPTRVVPGGLFALPVKKGSQQKFRKSGAGPYRFRMEYVDPNNTPSAEQYTVVEDQSHNYAEKTYLLVSVVDPKKNDMLISDYDGCGFLQERKNTDLDPPLVFNGDQNLHGLSPSDNNVAHGGDLIYSPDVSTVSQGEPGLPFVIENGKSTGRSGESAFYVRAVARYRRDDTTGVARKDIRAILQAAVPCPTTAVPIDPSPAFSVDLWVDQEDFFPRSQPPGRHANRPQRDRIDWVEKQTLDLFTDILNDPAARPEEKKAVEATVDVYTDRGPDQNHTTGQDITFPRPPGPFGDDQFRIHFSPTDAGGFRWGTAMENPTQLRTVYPKAGFSYLWSFDRFAYFEYLVTHEMRHALQFRIMGDAAAGDNDQDGLPVAPVWAGFTVSDGWRLVDQRNVRKAGTNTEFDFWQESFPGSFDAIYTKTAIERDALRTQRHTTILESTATDLVLASPTLTVATNQEVAFLAGVVDKTVLFGDSDVGGVLVKAEVISGGCQIAKPLQQASSWDLFAAEPGVGQSLGNGDVTVRVKGASTPGSCTMRLKMIKPASLTSGETEGPAHDIQITVQ